MASESLTHQPPTSGGSAKYIVFLLLFLAGGLGVYFATSGDEPKPAPLPEVKTVERNTSLSNDTVQIPVEEEEVDAGEPPKEEPGTIKRPRASNDVWSCEGDVDQAAAQRVINQAQSSVRGCYERALRNNNQLQGKLEMDVRISADGKVTHTRVHGTLHDPEVAKCVQGLAKQWAFPPVSKAPCAIFSAPFKLTPKN
jgi:hypothetical protein